MKKIKIGMSLIIALSLLCACSHSDFEKSSTKMTQKNAIIADGDTVPEYNSENPDPLAPVIDGLDYVGTVKIEYARCFQIFRYEGGYSVIRMDDGRDYIAIPENKKVPDMLPSSCVVLQKPLDNIYLAASASMSLFDSIDALDHISLSGTDVDGWYIENAKKAMQDGKIIFAGKYSEPDFELLLSKNCDIAIESTMIMHTPETMEKIEELGIPVLIDRSSFETHPLGRTEWVKLYGELTDRTGNAVEYFNEQSSMVEELKDFENTNKTVAFFYINGNGTVVTRKSNDYVSKMIELAGGRYVFENLGANDKSSSSSINMTMEEFYSSAKDADYLIYNASIDNPIYSIDELIEKNALFKDFKAVKNDNVWCCGKYLYQASHISGNMIKDLNMMLTDPKAEEMDFITRLH